MYGRGLNINNDCQILPRQEANISARLFRVTCNKGILMQKNLRVWPITFYCLTCTHLVCFTPLGKFLPHLENFTLNCKNSRHTIIIQIPTFSYVEKSYLPESPPNITPSKNVFIRLKALQILSRLVKISACISNEGTYQVIPGNLQKYVSTNHSLLQCKTLPAYFNNNIMVYCLLNII